ncbi:MAG: hypothetical protein ACT4PW_03065 [Acidimicrobiia bacterium]
MLAYYAITNAAAWTLPGDQRRWPRPLAGLGVAGCLLLAVALPTASVASGSAVLAAGTATWFVRVDSPAQPLSLEAA